MFVSNRAKAGVMALAVSIVQNAPARQMIDGISEPLAAATPHYYLLALVALFGYRRDSTVSTEGGVVSLG